MGPAAPQSTHFPILLLASGTDPITWSVRIGPKGPERMDRPGYPPMPLEPVDVSREGTTDAWSYRAKDTATGAEISVRLTREVCSDAAGAKYTFRAFTQHAQLGALNGCARIAAELFPKITNQTADDDADTEKKPPTLPGDVIKFKSPVAVAYLNAAGKVVVSVGATKKIAAPAGADLALSHDGKRLLFTREDLKGGPERAIVLYDFSTGRAKDLVHGAVRQAFWSPDDSRVAFLNLQDQKWQVWAFSTTAPETAAPLYVNNVDSLHGWVDAHTLLASDAQNAYWIPDDGKPMETVSLRDIYGPAFQVASSGTLRVNPINADLLLVSANYATPPAGAPTDAKGIAAGFFLYELRSKRRVLLSPPNQWARNAEWSRDGVQVFYTGRVSPTSWSIFRIFWDASAGKRYQDGTDLVVGQ
jgi:uncharacterized membrane protein